MTANIKDVSKLAGVSISTVSRVINKAPNINPDIREKVLIAIHKLGYEPNRIAQSLSGNPIRVIGIAASRASNTEYTSMVLRAIALAAEKEEYHILPNFSTDEHEELDRCISMIKGRIVQGFILLGTKAYDLLIERLSEMNVPLVVIGRVSSRRLAEKIYSVDTDNRKDCMEATNYLFSLGHRRIACIHSRISQIGTNDRLNGYIDAHKQAGLPVDYSIITDGGYSIDDAYHASLQLLEVGEKPTAILATDDVKAIGAFKAIVSLGLKIPEDISIIGHNNYAVSQMTAPSLTTIDVPIHQLGEIATQMFLKQLRKEPCPIREILPTRLIVRESTAPRG